MTEKEAFRKIALPRRLSPSEEDWNTFSGIIEDQILSHPLFLNARDICLYAPIRREVDTWKIWREARRLHKRTAFPRRWRRGGLDDTTYREICQCCM